MADGPDGLPFTELDDTGPDAWRHPPLPKEDEDADGGNDDAP